VHCSSDALKCHPAELSTEEARELIVALRDLGVFDFAISGGEPLTRKDVISLVAFAADSGLRVGLGSNGSTITLPVARALVDAGLHRLQISIDGVRATHDLARRWLGLFDRGVHAIEVARAAGLRVHVCFTAHRLNYRDLPRVVEACAEWGVTRFNFSRLVPTGRGRPELDLSREEWALLVREFESLRVHYADRMEFSSHLAQMVLVNDDVACAPGFIGCQAGVGQACIGTQGEVMPCVLLPVVVGNVRERPLHQIWQTAPELLMLRDRSHLTGVCGACELRDRCGGCRGVAYGYTGDFLASDPRCWKPILERADGPRTEDI
jgi:radical SAM protein with 4Fe4S-binding SPASM domain